MNRGSSSAFCSMRDRNVDGYQPALTFFRSVSSLRRPPTLTRMSASPTRSVATFKHGRCTRHAPARLEYRVRVPDGGRLDVGLGVVRADAPVDFAIAVQPPGRDAVTLLEETYSDSEHWVQRSLDLTRFEGAEVSLVLTATSDRVGTVAHWVAPTISGSRNTRKPNVIFYIIDSAGADFMSVYGYNRRTTPYIARLAAEGAVFENAYSNASYTNPSTRSFVTSLHDSVLRGTGGRGLPEQAMTMAQHMRAGGYQTAMFTSNPNAGSATGPLGAEAQIARDSRFEQPPELRLVERHRVPSNGGSDSLRHHVEI